MLEGIPTQAEMRRNPSGAVDKHQNWQYRNKQRMAEWKNIRLRLHASGALENVRPDATDVANFEQFRPSGGPGELNMHNEQIQGKVMFQSPPGAGPVVVLTPDVEAFLKDYDPDLLGKIGLLSNEVRATVLEKVRNIMAEHLLSNKGSVKAVTAEKELADMPTSTNADRLAKARAVRAKKLAEKKAAEAAKES